MTRLDGLEILTFETAGEWEAWLAEHHETWQGAWLKIAKKRSGYGSISVSDALDVALCHGWIDGLRKSHDEAWFLQKYTPRRSRSAWSRVNTDRVAALIAAGRMRAPGLAQVSAAKADGRWDAAYESQRRATVPADLAAALARNETARQAFESLGKSERYAVLLPLLKARSPAERAARVGRAVTDLARRRADP